jgi:hypothetical protein
LSWCWLRNILIYVEGVGVTLCRTLLQSLAKQHQSKPQSCLVYPKEPSWDHYCFWPTSMTCQKWLNHQKQSYLPMTAYSSVPSTTFVGSHTELAYSIVGLIMDVYAADFTGLVQSFKLRRINSNVLLPLPIVLLHTTWTHIRYSRRK